MALDPRFRGYLQHFGRTVPVRELVSRAGEDALTALRHDIDYDIDVALDAAFWEERLGARASYYILHDAPYAADPRLLDKCLQIQDYGHEIGLHCNLLSAWHRGEIDDVAAELHRILERWRAAGLDVTGLAAHGDRLCYEAGFANYWLFRELRPADLPDAETGMTAEGTRAGEADRRIDYPPDGHVLRRADGKSLELWSLSLADYGLDYEASRVPVDRYYSDSGGAWKRSPDPITEPFDGGRRLVLMHPIHWRHAQRHIYILSTARSGSKWLATFLDAATSLTARHEFTLNHRLGESGPVPDKRTGSGFTTLMERRDDARDLIAQSRSWSESLATDYAEANVYLERFLDLLPCDDVNIHIHLHRDPFAVVRSLVGRGWYDVPFDDRHPAVDIPGWSEMSQVEQAAWYVRDVNERLARHCRHSLEFERMVTDLDYLSGFLLELGVPVHRRLAQAVFSEVVNATRTWTVPPIDEWAASDRAALARILGPTGRNQPGALSRFSQLLRTVIGRGTKSGEAAAAAAALPARPPALLLSAEALRRPGLVSLVNTKLMAGSTPVQLSFDSERAGYVLIGGGRWHGARDVPASYLSRLKACGSAHALPVPAVRPAGADRLRVGGYGFAGLARTLARRPALTQLADCPALRARPAWGGFVATASSVQTLRLALGFDSQEGALRTMLLSYDEAGTLIAQKDLGLLSPAWPVLAVHFRPDRRAASFNIALYHGRNADALKVTIEDFRLAQSPEQGLAGRSPDVIISALAQNGPQASEPWRATPIVGDVAALQSSLERRPAATIRRGNVEVSWQDGATVVSLIRPDRAGHLLLAPGLWQTSAPASQDAGAADGTWRIRPGAFLGGAIAVAGSSAELPLGLHLLSYDSSGRLSEKLQLGRLAEPMARLAFRMPLIPDLATFNVALTLPARSPPIRVAELILEID